MKTPHLLASFAVAATAAAAELKDSSTVVRDWAENTPQAKSLAGDLTLRGLSTLPLREFAPMQMPAFWDKPRDQVGVPSWGRPAPRVPNGATPVPPETLAGSKPRGAKPWVYGGETYWVTPLVPSQGE